MEQRDNSGQTLAVQSKINSTNLKKSQYTIALLNESFRVGLMSREEINNIQIQIMQILKELIARYTKGESSSVCAYTAESILNSILYCIDAYALGCDSPEEAICHLKSLQISKLYERGVKSVSRWLEEARELYKKVRKNKLNVGLESYDHTINEDIPLYFTNCGIVFDAHNGAASIDYQLTFDDMSINGILYMKNYLEHLWIENAFCKYFNSEDIEKLLSDFGRTIGMDYKIELINIFELVFNNAVFAILAGIPEGLRISQYHFDLLSGKLKALDDSEIDKYICQTVEKLVKNMNICELNILDYIYRYKTVFTQRVIRLVRIDSLRGIILTEKEEIKKGYTILFENGKEMKIEDFNLFIKKLMKLKNTEDKIALIKSGIESLNDFVDLLASDCLFGKEFEALFNELGDMELAILAKMALYEEIRSDFRGLRSVISEKKESRVEWHICFVEFLKKSGIDRIESIERLLGEIDYTEISFY
ncbi:MAG: DUF6179 domain-containing protein [Bacillota bacterium]|nr:DUF6179 domain-containing protein [Bacillota bacterium]